MESRNDLSSELTVFVLTVGAPSFAECVKRLEAQDCRCTVDVIENVAPMSRALQCMLDRCRTRFFVQVDEDMLLYPHAIRSLYTRLTESPANVAVFTCHLWDSHSGRVIYGLKIYRHEIVCRYPYHHVQSCEWEQIRRFTNDGFVDLRLPIENYFQPSEITLGEHGGLWTPQAMFLRYFTLECKIRRGRLGTTTTSATWVEEYAPSFLKRFLETGSDLDFYAVLGVLAGRLAPVNGPGQEKDYRDYDRLPGFQTLVRFVEDVKAELDRK